MQFPALRCSRDLIIRSQGADSCDRESTSNNRVKSGYTDRHRSPIDRVPDAGSLSVSCSRKTRSMHVCLTPLFNQGLPNALDPDPYRDNLNPQKPAPPTKTHAAESSAMARGSSSSSSRTETSLGVAYQRAATVSEESLAGGSDTYDELDEESSSGVLRK